MPCRYRLVERVFVCQATLLFIADAAVEIVAMAGFSPKGNGVAAAASHSQASRRSRCKSLHHGSEIITDSQVAEGVIVIVDQACDPRFEAEFVRVVVETVPEDRLRLLAGEGWVAVAAVGR